MFSLTSHASKTRLAIFTLALAAGLAAPQATPYASAQFGTSRVPRDDYYLAKVAFYEGDYRAAFRGFTRSLKTGVRIGQARWLDSVCYFSALGEFHFQQGNLVGALEAHESAIQVHLQNPGWMSRLSYPRIGPSTDRVQLKIRWGTLPTAMAELPDSMNSLEGSFDLQTPFEIGGAVNPAHTRRVDAVEVFRSLAVSLRRRAELLGDTSPIPRKTQTITSSFSSLTVPTGHWIGSWVEVLYGLALLSEGQNKEAIAHLESGTTSRALHHPLTGIALLERGKYQLRRGEYAKATALLHKASVAAAQYRQSTIVEESFRYLTDAFLASEGNTAMPPLPPVVLFAESERNPRLAAALLLNSAEVAVYGNDPSSSAGLLTRARTIMARLGLLGTEMGARLTYLEAITQYRAGNRIAAGKSMKLAIAQSKQTSLQRFHLALIEQLYKAGRKAITPRNAEILFSRALREPTDRDWRTNPLETITMLVSNHTGSMERWFELLIDRKEYGEAVRVAEQLKRHRFYSTLPFGGRILSLRWLVDGDQAMIGKSGMTQQKRLRDKYPALAELSRKAEKIRLKLKQNPLVPADEEQIKKQKALVQELRSVSNQLESLVREIALRREPAKLVFPPQPSLSAIQRGMNANQAILMFVTTDQGWHAWFIRRNMDEHWQIRNTKGVRRGIASLLKSLGNRSRNFALSTDDIAKEDWKKPAAGLWKALIGELPSQGWDGLDELVIIPDGMLWYLPFELLQVPAEQLVDVDESSTLLSQVQIRYAPVASLSVGDQRGHNPDLKTTVVGGQLFPKESSEYAGEMLSKLKEVFKDVEVIGKKKPLGASRFTAGALERLIVWNDIKVALKEPYGWSPAQYDRKSKESSLADWMEYPWGGPDQVIAPGFHTAAEGTLGPKATGYEIFLTACGLMSTGTRTALLSRWRTGGKAPAVFVREFTRGLKEHSASESYRTASELVRAETLSPDKEPRLRESKGVEEVTAEHPFFWGGYLLIDSGAEPTPKTPEVPPPVQPLADKAKEADGADKDVVAEAPKENPLVEALKKKSEPNIGDEVSDLLIDPTEAVDSIDE